MTTEDFFQAQLHYIMHTVLLPNGLSVPFKPNTSACIFVVFQFYPWFEFDFPLFQIHYNYALPNPKVQK